MLNIQNLTLTKKQGSTGSAGSGGNRGEWRTEMATGNAVFSLITGSRTLISS